MSISKRYLNIISYPTVIASWETDYANGVNTSSRKSPETQENFCEILVETLAFSCTADCDPALSSSIPMLNAMLFEIGTLFSPIMVAPQLGLTWPTSLVYLSTTT